MLAMTYRGGSSTGGDDLTPWERASVSIELWEKAVDLSTIDYEALVRRLAEIYEQHNVAAWRDARKLTEMARRRVNTVMLGDRDAIERVLRARRSWAS